MKSSKFTYNEILGTIKVPEAYFRKDRIRYLTRQEERLFKLLYNSNAQYVPYKKILIEIFGTDDMEKNNLTVLVTRLRAKLKDIVEIQNIQSKGYKLKSIE